jgi:fatty acid-binding protein DegV
MIRAVRGAVDRIYSLYYVETISYIMQNRILSPSHGVLGALLGIKPFLGIEDGHLVVNEKVRTRAQAIDRLAEFAGEFAEIEDIVILQHKSYLSEQTRMIQDRLTLDFPNQYFPYSIYGASLAALIGADATGIVVLEKETDLLDDDL